MAEKQKVSRRDESHSREESVSHRLVEDETSLIDELLETGLENYESKKKTNRNGRKEGSRDVEIRAEKTNDGVVEMTRITLNNDRRKISSARVIILL